MEHSDGVGDEDDEEFCTLQLLARMSCTVWGLGHCKALLVTVWCPPLLCTARGDDDDSLLADDGPTENIIIVINKVRFFSIFSISVINIIVEETDAIDIRYEFFAKTECTNIF